MSFLTELERWPEERLLELNRSATARDVERALSNAERGPADLAALMSPAALPYLEPMAAEANKLTRWHFGRTIGMYVPLYISNICGADCVYCGYAVRSGNKERRLSLTDEQIRRECELLAAEGFQSILLLTGEARGAVPPERIAEAVATAFEYMPSVAVEIYALDEDEYRLLCDHGLEGVTLYQETYHQPTYERVHLKGQKRNYRYRLDAPERAGKAGVRRLGVGALLGLYDWRVDGFWTALHARYLQRVCWKSAVAVSFPRLVHTPARFKIEHPVSDRDLVQFMLALRLFLPEIGFNMSTRERPALRDKLIPLGVTNMSAGSSTRPGGYGTYGGETLQQFSIDDARRPNEVAEAIKRAGYEPVWKDFDRAFERPRGAETP